MNKQGFIFFIEALGAILVVALVIQAAFYTSGATVQANHLEIKAQSSQMAAVYFNQPDRTPAAGSTVSYCYHPITYDAATKTFKNTKTICEAGK